VEEIREVLFHCAVYAGVPASAEAFRAAQAVIDAISHISTEGVIE
jgi:4-carboxymuconolactone decarboxylase